MTYGPNAAHLAARRGATALLATWSALASACSPAERSMGPEHRGAPSCTTVTGTAGVTFSTNQGETLAPTSERLSGVRYTRGLVALTSDRLLAAHARTVIVSDDAGCTWRPLAVLPFEYVRLVRASPQAAYAWPEGRAGLQRIDVDGTVRTLAPPVSVVRGAAAREGASGTETVRIAGGDGTIYESIDRGATWTRIGVPIPSTSLLLYSVEFDAANLNRAVAGTAREGAWLTEDGGRTWRTATLASTRPGMGQNVFSLAISPVDPSVVWAAGLDMGEEAVQGGSGRHIYRSTDGGRTYTVVLSQRPATGTPPRGGVAIINGPTLAPHPTRADVLYFVFSASFQNYGTDVIEVAASGQYTVRHNGYHDVGAIAFAPGRPGVMYLGVGSEQRCDPLPCP